MGHLDAQKQPAIKALPTEVREGGLQSVLAYLQRGMPRASLPNAIEKLSATPREEIEDPDVRKNALLALAIGSFWPEVSSWMRAHPGQMGMPQYQSAVQTVVGSRIKRFFEVEPKLGFRELRGHAVLLLSNFAEKWWGEHGTDDPVAIELQEVMRSFTRRYAGGNPPDLISSGMVTASDVIFGLYNTAHHAYEVQYRQPMTAETFREMLPAMRRVSLLLATQRLDIFTEGIMPAVIGDHDAFIQGLQMKGLTLSRSGHHWTIDFIPEVLEEIHRSHRSAEARRTRSRTGCPALFVLGGNGSNAISEYFDWTTTLLETYYYPTLEKR